MLNAFLAVLWEFAGLCACSSASCLPTSLIALPLNAMFFTIYFLPVLLFNGINYYQFHQGSLLL
jgi:hypothetical protein